MELDVMARKERLALFDLDGTLFDTARVNYEAYRVALAKVGVDLEYDYFLANCCSRWYRHFLPGLLGSHYTEALMEAVHDDKTALYPGMLHYAAENTALFELIVLMAERYNLAVVTTATRKSTLALLGHFGREGLFDLIVAQEDVKKAKPDPEGYLKAMRFFDKTAEDTVIFEDSEVGLAAALAATPNVLRTYAFEAPPATALRATADQQTSP